jgi:hypothetical protein
MIFFITILENKKRNLHLFITIIATLVLFSNIGLVLLFEYPFSGNLISKDSFTGGFLARYQKP